MNFYKLHIERSDGCVISEWFASEREAVTRRLTLFKEGKLAGLKKDHTIEMHCIPVRKQELLEWLRSECVRNI